MKLSEQYDEITGVKTTGGRSLKKKNIKPEVAQLERYVASLKDRLADCAEENEALKRLADSNPWYAGMVPNIYYCIYCRGSGRFTMNPKRDTRHGHKDDCPFLALLTEEDEP